MAKLTRQLHERIRGDNTENKDWWRLVFDTEAKRFYIEHEWNHEPGLEKWLDINAKYSLVWPNITVKRELPPDAKDWEGKPDKANLLSPTLAQVIEATQHISGCPYAMR